MGMDDAAVGHEQRHMWMLIIQAHGSHVENWVSTLVIQETQHAPSVKAAAEPKQEQAASRPLTTRTEKAVRKSMAPPESSGEGTGGLD